MDVKLFIDKLEVIMSGEVMLPQEDDIFEICLNEQETELRFGMCFLNDKQESEQVISPILNGDKLLLQCKNFDDSTGTNKPLELAVMNGHKIYLMIWSTMHGSIVGKKRVRCVKYTLYRDENPA